MINTQESRGASWWIMAAMSVNNKLASKQGGKSCVDAGGLEIIIAKTELFYNETIYGQGSWYTQYAYGKLLITHTH